jgi:hypothetical protein
LLGLLFVAALFLVGCAAGPNVLAHSAGAGGSIAGFWLGLWHGFICPVTFIISLFSDKVHFCMSEEVIGAILRASADISREI